VPQREVRPRGRCQWEVLPVGGARVFWSTSNFAGFVTDKRVCLDRCASFPPMPSLK
jgi:hypothetical protein